MTRMEARVIKSFTYTRPIDGTTVLVNQGTSIHVEDDATALVFGDWVDILPDEYALLDVKGVRHAIERRDVQSPGAL